MITKSFINQKLRDSLSSPAWSKVKNSLLGNELIALGTEVIYNTAIASDAIQNNLDYKNCSYEDLITLARRHGVCVSAYDPSYVIKSAPAISKPYEGIVDVGGVSFISPNWCAAGKDSVYYLSQSSSIYSSEHLDYYTTATQVQSSSSHTVTIDGVSYIRLSPEAIPDSVRMVIRDGSVLKELPLKSTPNIGSGDYFKLTTLEDGCIAVNISELTVPYDAWEVYYLTAVTADFTSTPDVLDTHTGSEYSIEHARSMYANEWRKYYVISSITDMREFAKSCKFVQDARVIADGENITIWIKPENPNSALSTFPEVEFNLSIYGPIFYNYSALKGGALHVQFVITPDVLLQDQDKAHVEQIISDRFAYSKLDFDSTINTYEVQNLIFNEIGVHCDVYINVNEDMTSDETKLLFPPEPGSVYFTSLGEVHAWDNDGSLYALVDSVPIAVNYLNASPSVGTNVLYSTDAAPLDIKCIDLVTMSVTNDTLSHQLREIVPDISNFNAFYFYPTSDEFIIVATGSGNGKLLRFTGDAWVYDSLRNPIDLVGTFSDSCSFSTSSAPAFRKSDRMIGIGSNVWSVSSALSKITCFSSTGNVTQYSVVLDGLVVDSLFYIDELSFGMIGHKNGVLKAYKFSTVNQVLSALSFDAGIPTATDLKVWGTGDSIAVCCDDISYYHINDILCKGNVVTHSPALKVEFDSSVTGDFFAASSDSIIRLNVSSSGIVTYTNKQGRLLIGVADGGTDYVQASYTAPVGKIKYSTGTFSFRIATDYTNCSYIARRGGITEGAYYYQLNDVPVVWN